MNNGQDQLVKSTARCGVMCGVECSGLMVSALTPDRALRVRALARVTELRSWARQFTLIVPLSTQVYKWVPANLLLGVTLQWTSIPSRGEWKYS